MSNHSTTPAHDEGHATPGKDKKQTLQVLVLAVVLPLVVVVSLVRTYTASSHAGVEAADPEMAVMQRIQKVGKVEMGSTVHETRTGEQVFNAQCTNCHTAGLVGSPKFGDVAAWAPRIKTGFDALLTSALKGKNAMGPQGGGAFTDFEVARAVVYMANAAGAKFAEPAEPKAATAK